MGRGRPRKVDPETALDASMKVFWQKGFEGTSMTDLTEATGMAKPGLYATFGDKEALYAKALSHYFRGYGASVMDDLVRSQDPLHIVVRRFLNAVADATTDKATPGGCFVVNSINDCVNHPQQLEELTRSFDAERRGACTERFREAHEKGELPKETDPDTLAEFFAGQVVALAVMGRAGRSREALDRFIDTAMSVIPDLESKQSFDTGF